MDKAVESWLQMDGADMAKAAGLQSLVEVVVIVRAAVTARGLPAQAKSGGQVSQALAGYAGLLAGQGSLRTALSYLSQVEVGEGELAELKQRLEQSLAPRAAAQPPNVQAARQQQPARGRQASLTPAPRKMSNDVQPSFNYGQQPQQPSFMQPQEPPISNSYQQQYKPPSMEREALPPVPTFPSAFSTATSPSSASRSSNPLLGGRRTVDASVAPPAPQYQGFQPASTPQFTGFQPQQEPQYTTPGLPGGQQAQAPGIFNPAEATPAPALPPPAVLDRQPDQPGPGFMPPVSSGYGWNDPPPATVAKNAFSRQTATAPTPAAEPPQQFFTPTPVQQPAPTPAWGGFQPQQQQQHGGYHQQQQQEQAPPANQPSGWAGFQPAQQQQHAQQAPPANQQQQAAEPAQPPAPIPAEHQVIQDVMESLRSKCQQASSHPQIRRKLEDVSAKLDILYNKLRAGSLSGATLQGLHSILQHIWQYDYPAC